MKELPDTFKEYIIYQLEYGKIKMCSAFTSLFFIKDIQDLGTERSTV